MNTVLRPAGARSRALLLVLALTVAGPGCGGDDDDEQTAANPPAANSAVSAAGKLEGSDAFVAIKTSGGFVRAYVCDGKTGVAERFTGTQEGDKLELRSAGGARLTVDLSKEEVTGTFTTAKGESFDFDAARSDESGLYAAELKGKRQWAGWVVLPNGEQRGAVRRGDTVSAAPTLQPGAGAVTVAGQNLNVTQIDQFSCPWPLG